MNFKRVVGSVAVAGIVGASTLGIGAGAANASAAQPNSETAAVVAPAGWHGGWHGHGYGYGDGRGHDWGGWPGFRWHPWGWRH
jgi:hypothetical protein